MRKEKLTYYFSVEGETEKWYLDWLQDRINESRDAKYTVKLDSKIQKDPLARAKGMTILQKPRSRMCLIGKVKTLFMPGNSWPHSIA